MYYITFYFVLATCNHHVFPVTNKSHYYFMKSRVGNNAEKKIYSGYINN